MPGNKCQYFNCFKTTTKFPNLSMFRIPKDERHQTWIINSGKKLIAKNIYYLSYSLLKY